MERARARAAQCWHRRRVGRACAWSALLAVLAWTALLAARYSGDRGGAPGPAALLRLAAAPPPCREHVFSAASPAPFRSVLVTGAAGFVGFHTCAALRRRGFGGSVVGLDSFSDYYSPALKRARAARLLERHGVSVVRGDVCNATLVGQLLDAHRVDVVLHLAAQAGVRHSLARPLSYVRANVECFVVLLEALRQRPATRLVYASSSSVYGRNTKQPFAETDRTDAPASLYGATKKAGEYLAQVYRSLFGVRSIGLRFFTVYGPWGRPDMAYYALTRQALANETLRVVGDDVRRDFTYVDDIVNGVIGAMRRVAAAPAAAKDGDDGGAAHESAVYNLGNHRPERLTRLVALAEQCAGRRASKHWVALPRGDVLATFADVSRARRDLGYCPRWSLPAGMAQFCAWFRAEGDRLH